MAAAPKHERYPAFTGAAGESGYRLQIVIGASGAVTSVAGGPVTVAKNTTGVYDITLPRKFTKVRHFSGRVHRASGADLTPRLAAQYTPSRTLTFSTIVTAGTATEPSSGDFIDLDIVFFDEGT